MSADISKPNENKRLLVIDPSANHSGYCILNLNADKAFISYAGMIWTKDSWSKGKRLQYTYNAFNELLKLNINQVLTESFFVNPKQLSGSLVLPIINGFLHKLAEDYSITYIEVSPPSWRKVLNIKAIIDDKGKRNWKIPTADLVSTYTKLPEEIISNVTGKPRAIPHDLTDVMAIAIAKAKELGYNTVEVNKDCFNNEYILNVLKTEENHSKSNK